MKKLILALLLAPFAAHAGDALVSWEHPTTYVDGTTIPAGGIAATEIEYGVCNAGKTGFTGTTTTVSVAHPTNSRNVTNLAFNSWCFRARTVASGTAGEASDWTGIVWKTIPAKTLAPVSIRVQ